MNDRIQVTPTSGTVLQGDPVDMAMQFCQKVVHPLLMALVADKGPEGLVQFYASLMTHLALDMNGALGTRYAQRIVDHAQVALDNAKRTPAFHESAETKPANL